MNMKKPKNESCTKSPTMMMFVPVARAEAVPEDW
jgi:hypothetical protein